LWKRLVRDRGNVSCPLTDSALESERAPGIKQIGGSRLRTLMEGFVRQAVLIVGERAAVPAVVCVAGYTRVAVALILRVRYPELSSVKAESFRIHWSVSVNCAPYWL
jgi:hypothetical protein